MSQSCLRLGGVRCSGENFFFDFFPYATRREKFFFFFDFSQNQSTPSQAPVMSQSCLRLGGVRCSGENFFFDFFPYATRREFFFFFRLQSKSKHSQSSPSHVPVMPSPGWGEVFRREFFFSIFFFFRLQSKSKHSQSSPSHVPGDSLSCLCLVGSGWSGPTFRLKSKHSTVKPESSPSQAPVKLRQM
jgi:hypothetical protein